MTHRLDGLCIDIRQFEEKLNGMNKEYHPTTNGIVIPIGQWSKLLDPLIKLLKKHKRKE